VSACLLLLFVVYAVVVRRIKLNIKSSIGLSSWKFRFSCVQQMQLIRRLLLYIKTSLSSRLIIIMAYNIIVLFFFVFVIKSVNDYSCRVCEAICE